MQCGDGRLASSLTSRRRRWSRWLIGGETRDSETRDSETRDGETRLIDWRAVTITMLADSAASWGGWLSGLGFLRI